jgi:hypothetical protein
VNRSTGYTTAGPSAELAQIRVLAHRLDGAEDLDALIRLAAADPLPATGHHPGMRALRP